MLDKDYNLEEYMATVIFSIAILVPAFSQLVT
jgi:hypothetical protein